MWTNISCSGTLAPRLFSGGTIVGSFLYVFYGFNDKKNVLEQSIYRINLNSNCFWEEVENSDQAKYAVHSFALTSYGKDVYIFAGNKQDRLTNSLIKITIDTNLTFNELFSNYESPGEIMDSSLEYLAGSLYLFGGSYKTKKSNNLWRFNLLTIKWEKVRYFGHGPSPRSHHASAAEGDIMVIWGGQGQDDYYNDGFSLDINTMVWSHISSGEKIPSARSSCCIAIYLPIIYIYGGVKDGLYTGSLWMYDIRTMEYTQGPDSFAKRGISNAKCFIRNINSEAYLYTVFGQSQGDKPEGLVQRYSINKSKWALELVPESSEYERTEALTVMLESQIYIIGGHAWATLSFKDVISFNLTSMKFEKIAEAFLMTSHSASAYFGAKIYVYGGRSTFEYTFRFNNPSDSFFSLDILQICGDNCRNTCTPGTFFNNGSCEICPQGSFSKNFGSEKCVLCPVGTYNAKYGANNPLQCLPCPAKYFNDIQGAYSCKDCPSSYICPVGTSNPIIYEYEDSFKSIQPEIFQRNTSETLVVSLSAQILAFFISLTIIFLLYFFASTRRYLFLFDLYSDFHNYEINCPLYKKRNTYGTVFSCFFVIGSIFVFIQSMVIFYEDNVDQIKSSLPLVILEREVEEFTANFTIEMTLINYGGQCSEYGECASINVIPSDLEYDRIQITCQKTGKQDCSILTYCKKCTLISNAVIKYKIQEIYSYTSAIQVNFTSTSSIPGKISSIFMKILPKENTIFRGYSPTVFSYALTPSLYKSIILNNQFTNTGYHVSSDTLPVSGTSFSPSQLGFTADLLIDVELKKSISGLYTEVFSIQSTFNVIITLLGSIPGVMSIMGSAMAIVEIIGFKLEKKKTKSKNLDNLKEFRKMYRPVYQAKNDDGTIFDLKTSRLKLVFFN